MFVRRECFMLAQPGDRERAMTTDEAQLMRAKIAELAEQLARFEADGHSRHQGFVVAHVHALEAAFIALVLELREELNLPDLIERISARLTYIAAPALRRLNDPASARNADAVDSFASRLDQAEKLSTSMN